MKIVVIGLGSMGKRRIRILKALYPACTIIGIDSSEERMEEAKRLYGISSFSSIDEAEQEEADCAFVCTSPLSHHMIILKCLSNNWNVFTEINLVADGYDDMMALAREQNKVLFLSSTPIYRAEMMKINEIVKQNGKPFQYLYHVGQYLPDWHPWESYKNFFVGDKRTGGCREIFGIELPWMVRTFGKVEKVTVLSKKLTSLDIPYQDSYLVQMVHESGAQGVFAVDVTCRQAVRKLEIYNEDLYLEWNGRPETLKMKNLETGLMDAICEDRYQNEKGYSEFVNEYAYLNELQEFFQVLEGKTAKYGFAEDKEVLRLIDEIESM